MNSRSMDSMLLAGHTKDFIRPMQDGGLQQLYYHDCLGRIPGYTTRAPPVGQEVAAGAQQPEQSQLST